MKRSADSLTEPQGSNQGNWRHQGGESNENYSSKPSYEDDNSQEGGASQGNQSFVYGILPENPCILQELKMSKAQASVIIGYSGTNASKIRKSSRCQIHVNTAGRNDPLQVVSLSGTVNQIDKAIQLIRELLEPEKVEQEFQVMHNVSTTLDIYPEMVGSILGKNGATIKSLREKTGCRINIRDRENGSDYQKVHIEGPMDKVRNGYNGVKSLLDRFDPSRVRSAAGRQFLSNRVLGGAGGEDGDAPESSGGRDNRDESYGDAAPPPSSGDRNRPYGGPSYNRGGGDGGRYRHNYHNYRDDPVENDYRGQDYGYSSHSYYDKYNGPRPSKMARYGSGEGGGGSSYGGGGSSYGGGNNNDDYYGPSGNGRRGGGGESQYGGGGGGG
eukprot:CAMPEP_0175065124 /NCGR_PEP_ID=MMETSP0052_2-20121109/15736_1 /TAXON_ID=51329 ORGANISM="Polytomella parva, Strain SAG 63-3" /NCGR_SAMPLE_ID=MMETSP0052_2 /ASSEMBLY_ACC=CAM_ASM_000194 /LENGTH=384 /DNA_ID=CAMNT_0016331595 /DNA_START=88 /DNA_END=1239 /DNA_ORIENTATION=+